MAGTKSIQVLLPNGAHPRIRRSADILGQRIRERCPAQVSERESNFVITLELDNDFGREGFALESTERGIRIIGNDAPGLLYGVGRFLHTSGYRKDGFTPSDWRGTSVPQGTIRGLYFATHFHNWYQVAPEDKIGRYLEDLALWGGKRHRGYLPLYES